MAEADPATTKEMEEAVRRYLTKIVVRYLPFSVAVLVFLTMVTLVPTRVPSSTSGAFAGGADGVAAGSAAGAAGDQGQAVGGGGGVAGGDAPAPGAAAGAAASGSPGANTRGGTGPQATLSRTAASGKTRGGIACGPNVRQVPWSKYSPMCVPAFTGNNGGATSFGVTGSTITATFRISDSGQAAALAAASPSLSTAAQTAYFQDMSTYMDYFNGQFELYGRKVVMKQFAGQGDWVAEYQGQNTQGAQADAATARQMGAFADISSTAVSTTPMYAGYLASDKVMSVGGVAGSDAFFASYSPYIFSIGASTSRLIDWMPDVVCQRMMGQPAIFAGDATLAASTRKFGLIYPTNPDFQIVGRAIKDAMTQCGAAPASTYEYAIDLSTMATDSTNAMAQMRAAGVTTVLCGCDTVVPKFLTNAASGQRYYPEWVSSGAADSLAQGYDQSVWSHAISPNGNAVSEKTSEAHRVYQQATNGKEPVSLYYYAAYLTALLFVEGVQNAGPNLTPASFQQGFFRLPPSLPDGDAGPWVFGDKHWTPQAGARIGWYDPNATSGQNGAQGAWQNCAGDDGRVHPWQPRSGFGAAGTQLHCFGK